MLATTAFPRRFDAQTPESEIVLDKAADYVADYTKFRRYQVTVDETLKK